jgi:hypothetical protein
MTRLERIRNKKGSNQFEVKNKTYWRGWIFFYITFIVISGLVYNIGRFDGLDKAYAEQPIISAWSENVTPTPTPDIQDETEAIREEIRNTFGEHADKAFKVLSCENASLNPKAVNTAGNVPAGSRDMGIFQINEYWQGVHAKFLLNWETNIRLAYQIFEENGHSFERWTCGRKFGI